MIYSWDSLTAFFQNDLVFVLSIAAGCFLMGQYLEKRRFVIFRTAIAFAGFAVASIYLSFLAQPSPCRYELFWSVVKYVVLFGLFILFVLWLYRTNWQIAAFIATVSYCIQNMCERLVEIVREWLKPPILIDRMILIVMLTLSLIFVARMLQATIGPEENSYQMMDSRLMLLIALVVLFINIGLDMMLRAEMIGASLQARSYVHIFSAVISFLSTVLSMCQFRQADSDKKAEIANNLLRISQKRYEEEKLLHDTINIKCHDIRHQLAALGRMGYNQELREIGKLVRIYDTRYKTGCDALDVMLSIKALTCVQEGITLTCVADGQQMQFMDTADIYALFGNILDNAVDAVRQVQDPEKKVITASVAVHKNMLWITEDNFYEGELTFRDNVLVTSKADAMFHGYGMKSISILVNKYGGSMQISPEDSVFHLSIMIPIPQSKK